MSHYGGIGGASSRNRYSASRRSREIAQWANKKQSQRERAAALRAQRGALNRDAQDPQGARPQQQPSDSGNLGPRHSSARSRHQRIRTEEDIFKFSSPPEPPLMQDENPNDKGGQQNMFDSYNNNTYSRQPNAAVPGSKQNGTGYARNAQTQQEDPRYYRQQSATQSNQQTRNGSGHFPRRHHSANHLRAPGGGQQNGYSGPQGQYRGDANDGGGGGGGGGHVSLHQRIAAVEKTCELLTHQNKLLRTRLNACEHACSQVEQLKQTIEGLQRSIKVLSNIAHKQTARASSGSRRESGGGAAMPPGGPNWGSSGGSSGRMSNGGGSGRVSNGGGNAGGGGADGGYSNAPRRSRPSYRNQQRQQAKPEWNNDTTVQYEDEHTVFEENAYPEDEYGGGGGGRGGNANHSNMYEQKRRPVQHDRQQYEQPTQNGGSNGYGDDRGYSDGRGRDQRYDQQQQQQQQPPSNNAFGGGNGGGSGSGHQRDVSGHIDNSQEFPDEPVQMRRCNNCGRAMRLEVYEKHVAKQLCKQKKRKAFDVQKQRIMGMVEQSGADTSQARRKAQEIQRKVKREKRKLSTSSSDWKKKSEQLRAAMRAGRGQGGPVQAVQYNQVPCPHCGRTFNESAAERHIPKCKDIVNKPRRLVRKRW